MEALKNSGLDISLTEALHNAMDGAEDEPACLQAVFTGAASLSKPEKQPGPPEMGEELQTQEDYPHEEPGMLDGSPVIAAANADTKSTSGWSASFLLKMLCHGIIALGVMALCIFGVGLAMSAITSSIGLAVCGAGLAASASVTAMGFFAKSVVEQYGQPEDVIALMV